MPDWLIVVILGIVEGLTEFIPVSSTGHLLIVEHWLAARQSDLFNVVIQCGAVLAVLPLFRDRIAMMLRWREPASRDMSLKIFGAFFITAVGGLILDKLHFELPETVQPVAAALIVGGLLFIAVELALKGKRLTDNITWTLVVIVALAQLLAAVFPGASRSGSTIIFAMLFGLNRVAATEFSFLVGIPTLLAAGALKIFKALKSGVSEDWVMLGLGAVVAAVVSFIAVKWLLRYVQTHPFVSFGVYRIVLGVLLLFFSLAQIMNLIPPDLQASILCEDVRTEISGQQTLIGVIGVVPAPVLPIGFFKLCLWTRWCGGVGEFLQQSLILGCDDDQPIAQAEVKFALPEMNSHATNVHVFGGVHFQKHGIYTVEIRIDGEVKLRFPLPVIPVQQRPA